MNYLNEGERKKDTKRAFGYCETKIKTQKYHKSCLKKFPYSFYHVFGFSPS